MCIGLKGPALHSTRSHERMRSTPSKLCPDTNRLRLAEMYHAPKVVVVHDLSVWTIETDRFFRVVITRGGYNKCAQFLE